MFRSRPPSLPADLSTVRRAVWSVFGVRLHTADGATRVRLFPRRAGALAAVRRVRFGVPADRQERWERAAWPAVDLLRRVCPARPLRDFERLDADPFGGWVFILGAVAGEGCGLAIRLLNGNAAALIIGPAVGLLLAALRWFTARRTHGRVSLAVPGVSTGTGELALAYAGLPAAAFIGLAAVRWCGLPLWACGIPVAAAVANVIRAIWRLTRQQQAFLTARQAEAVAEWNALHADPQREPAWQAALWDGPNDERGPAADRRR